MSERAIATLGRGLRRPLVVCTFVLVACGAPPLPSGELASPSDTPGTPPSTTPIDSEAPPPPPETAPSIQATVVAPPSAADRVSVAGEWTDLTANLVGLPSTCGNLSNVAAHPTNRTVITGVSKHGLWQLNETGSEWTPIGTDPASDTIGNRTKSVFFDPSDELRFWQNGSYGPGAYRTDDGGRTFQRLGDIAHLDYLSVDLTDPDRQTALAGVHESTNVFRTIDGGQTWTSLADNLPVDAGFTAYPLVINADTYLLGSNKGSGSGIFRSVDGGATWTMVSDIAMSSPALVVDGTIYWLASGGEGLVASRDGGLTFQLAGGRTGGTPVSLLQLPGGLLATHNDSSVLVSSDEGRTWSPVGPEMPVKPWGLTYSHARESFFIWRFSCDFSVDGEPVLPMSVMELDVTIDL